MIWIGTHSSIPDPIYVDVLNARGRRPTTISIDSAFNCNHGVVFGGKTSVKIIARVSDKPVEVGCIVAVFSPFEPI